MCSPFHIAITALIIYMSYISVTVADIIVYLSGSCLFEKGKLSNNFDIS